MDRKILLEYFLSYTPELNSVELQWMIIKAGLPEVCMKARGGQGDDT